MEFYYVESSCSRRHTAESSKPITVTPLQIFNGIDKNTFVNIIIQGVRALDGKPIQRQVIISASDGHDLRKRRDAKAVGADSEVCSWSWGLLEFRAKHVRVHRSRRCSSWIIGGSSSYRRGPDSAAKRERRVVPSNKVGKKRGEGGYKVRKEQNGRLKWLTCGAVRDRKARGLVMSLFASTRDLSISGSPRPLSEISPVRRIGCEPLRPTVSY